MTDEEAKEVAEQLIVWDNSQREWVMYAGLIECIKHGYRLGVDAQQDETLKRIESRMTSLEQHLAGMVALMARMG